MQNDVNARMNWFERHLNWTAAGMGIFSIVLTIFLIIVGMGWNILDIRWHGFGYKSGILLFLVVFSCLLLSETCYGWILYKKNRSPAFLFFFLPALALSVLLLTNYTVYTTFALITFKIPLLSISLLTQQINPVVFTQIKMNPLPLLFLLQIILQGIAWLVLFLLRNKSSLPAGMETPVSHKPNFLKNLFNPKKKYAKLLLSLVIFPVVLSGLSFLNLSYGYTSLYIKKVIK
jgi:hypothetical protein